MATIYNLQECPFCMEGGFIPYEQVSEESVFVRDREID